MQSATLIALCANTLMQCVLALETYLFYANQMDKRATCNKHKTTNCDNNSSVRTNISN